MSHNASDDNPEGFFDPEDMAEMSSLFNAIANIGDKGFIIEFQIDYYAAEELVELWVNAIAGDRRAKAKSWLEYSKIIAELARALARDQYES